MLSRLYYKLRLFRFSSLLGSGSRLHFLRHRFKAGALLFFFALPLPIVALAYMAMVSKSDGSRLRDLTCLTRNIYHEARGEPLVGQFAVAEVTLNRVASDRFPDSMCDVVYEKRWDKIRGRYVGGFSWTELEVPPEIDHDAWREAWHVAETVTSEHYTPTLEGALFYHSRTIRPSWSRGKQRVARIGRHVFYR
ncbi:MAG: cell wall hydrolase [Gammaproteobacteria bacterium]|nr:cell wall hydrolase [Gammaproteobacteria bacterium]